jgi:hypothetical protein
VHGSANPRTRPPCHQSRPPLAVNPCPPLPLWCQESRSPLPPNTASYNPSREELHSLQLHQMPPPPGHESRRPHCSCALRAHPRSCCMALAPLTPTAPPLRTINVLPTPPSASTSQIPSQIGLSRRRIVSIQPVGWNFSVALAPPSRDGVPAVAVCCRRGGL